MVRTAASEERVFTVAEAAEFARVTPAVIRRWFDEGLRHFPTVKAVASRGPRQEIVRLSSLLAFIESREVGGVAEVPPPPGNPVAKAEAKARAAKAKPRPDDPFNLMGGRGRRGR
jgi:hypothetical protein